MWIHLCCFFLTLLLNLPLYAHVIQRIDIEFYNRSDRVDLIFDEKTLHPIIEHNGKKIQLIDIVNSITIKTMERGPIIINSSFNLKIGDQIKEYPMIEESLEKGEKMPYVIKIILPKTYSVENMSAYGGDEYIVVSPGQNNMTLIFGYSLLVMKYLGEGR